MREAEIISTATNATTPLFTVEDVAPVVHVNAIGSYRPDMCELPTDLVRRSTILVDSEQFCSTESGELINAFGARSTISGRVTELGWALDGLQEAVHTSPTLYKAVGNARQDLYAIAFVLENVALQKQHSL